MLTVRVNIWDKPVSHSPAHKIAQSLPQPEYLDIDPHAVIKSSALDKIRVQGGTSLNGEIAISGAKNAALKHFCATLLTGDAVQFTNTPVGLKDLQTLAALLQEMGVTVALREDGLAVLQAANITSTRAP